MLKPQPLNDLPPSGLRKTVNDVPHSHALLKSRVMYLRSPGGINMELKLVESTTNGVAIDTMERRIQARTEARRNGVGHGVYAPPPPSEMTAKTMVVLDMRLSADERYAIKIEVGDSGGYKVDREYEVSLQKAVRTVMQKADMRLAAISNQAHAPHPGQRTGYQSGMRM